jgi:hypothetical protein
MIKIKQKIINLGLPKTATSSFISAMKENGFETAHWNKNMCDSLISQDYDKIYNFVRQKDVFADLPWALIYKQLNENFKCKFIYLKRDKFDWIKSCLRYFDINKNPGILGGNRIREYIFGSHYPINNEQKYLDYFCYHENNIINYFKNKKNFISVDLNDGGWEKVCDFLKLTKFKFPQLNKNNNN